MPAAWTGIGWASAAASSHQRAIPIDPTSRTLRHIAGATSAGPTHGHDSRARSATRGSAAAPGPHGQQVGPIGDDEHVAIGRVGGARPSDGGHAVGVIGRHDGGTIVAGRVRQPAAPVPLLPDASTITTTSRSAGPTHVATCTSTARASDAAAVPPIASAAPGPRSAPTGASSKCPAAATMPASSAPGRASGHCHRPVDRPPAEADPEGVGVVAAPAPHVAAERRRGGRRLGDPGRRRQVMAPSRLALTLDVGGEAGHVAVPARSPAPTVTRGAQRPHRPQADRRHQRGAGEDQEHRRPGHDGDDAGDHRRAQTGHDPSQTRPGAAAAGLRHPDRLGIPRRHAARGPPQRPPPWIAGRRRQRRPIRGRRDHVARGRATDPHAAGTEQDDAGIGHRRASADGLAVDAARHTARQLQQLDRPVGGHVEQSVVGLQRGVAERDRDRSRAADDVAAGAERCHRAGPGPAFADDDHDRLVGADRRPSVDGATRSLARGPARLAPTMLPRRTTGARQRLVAGHGPAVDPDGQPGIEAEGVAEGAERIVARGRGHRDATPRRVLDLQGGDGGSGHAPMGVAASRKGNDGRTNGPSPGAVSPARSL